MNSWDELWTYSDRGNGGYDGDCDEVFNII
jgi:hypothetical protein